MKALNDPVYAQAFVDPQVTNALTPNPSQEDMNQYMLEFSERNQISLEEINSIGHKYTKEWNNIPSIPSIPGFGDLQGNKSNPYGGDGGVNPNNQGFNPSNQGFNPSNKGFNPNNQGFNPNNQGFNPNNQGFNPNNQGFNQNSQGFNPSNKGFNPNNQGFNPNNQGFNPNNQGFNQNNQGINNNDFNNQFINQGINQQNPSLNPNTAPILPANLVPNFYVPGNIQPKNNPTNNRSSINSLNDIDYYPEIEGPPIQKQIPL